MRIALLSDIHGNSIALDAVLTDIEQRGGVDEHWVLGDIVALGPDPVGVLERLTVLPADVFVRGNTDRYVVTGERPGGYGVWYFNSNKGHPFFSPKSEVEISNLDRDNAHTISDLYLICQH